MQSVIPTAFCIAYVFCLTHHRSASFVANQEGKENAGGYPAVRGLPLSPTLPQDRLSEGLEMVLSEVL